MDCYESESRGGGEGLKVRPSTHHAAAVVVLLKVVDDRGRRNWTMGRVGARGCRGGKPVRVVTLIRN